MMSTLILSLPDASLMRAAAFSPEAASLAVMTMLRE
jgi:hypothetical protein